MNCYRVILKNDIILSVFKRRRGAIPTSLRELGKYNGRCLSRPRPRPGRSEFRGLDPNALLLWVMRKPGLWLQTSE